MEWLYPVISVLIFILIFLGYRTYQFSLQKRVFENVQHCVRARWQTLCDYFYSAQKKQDLKKEYRLSPSDELFISTILIAFQEFLNNRYFSESISASKENGTLSKQDFFWKTLFLYLLQYTNKKAFNEHEMLVPCFEHSTDGNIKRIYDMTDFGVVYYKMLLIAINQTSMLDAYAVTEALDTKKVRFFVY